MLMSLPMLRGTKDSSMVGSECRHKIELRNLMVQGLLGEAFSRSCEVPE